MQYATLPAGAKVSKGISKDQARPALTCGNLVQAGEQWELHVTDSYKAARVPVSLVGEIDDAGPALTPGPLSADALKAIEKTGAFRANGTVEPLDKFGQPTGVTLARDVDDAPRMPDLPQLWPDDVYAADRFEVTLNPQLLLELAQTLGVTHKRGGVTLTFNLSRGNEGQYLRAIPVTVNGEPSGLIMPIRGPRR